MWIYTKSMLAHIYPAGGPNPTYFALPDQKAPRRSRHGPCMVVDNHQIPFITARLTRLMVLDPEAREWYYTGDEDTARAHFYTADQFVKRFLNLEITAGQISNIQESARVEIAGIFCWDKELVDTYIKNNTPIIPRLKSKNT